MGKVQIAPTTMGLPMSCVVVSCYDAKRGASMITLAYCAMVNYKPPMVAISMRPSRYSYPLVKETKDFVVNVPLAEQARLVDLAGIVSGRSVDKFELTKLNKEQAARVKAPLIAEFPINMECKVLDIVDLPTHNLIIGEIVALHADESLVDESGQLSSETAPFMMYYNRAYFAIGEKVGYWGFSKTPQEKTS